MKLPSRTVADQAAQYNFEKLERTVDSEPVTSLPTTDLYVGRRVVYSSSAGPWDFVLDDPNATYPWRFMGGPPLAHYIDTDQLKAGGGAGYADLATVGPTVTVPLAGDYEYVASVNGYIAAAGVLTIGLNVAGAAPAAPHLAQVSGYTAGTGGTMTWENQTLALAASAVLKVQYGASASNQNFRWRSLKVRPIRVG